MSKFKKNKGFTLIELLVALAIVGIILLAFFRSIDSTTRMDAKNDRDIKALNLAQSEIENLRNQIKDYGQLERLEIKDVQEIIEDTDSTENKIEFLFNKENKKITIDLNDISGTQKEIVYKKSIGGKEFEIYLDISKSEVDNTNMTNEMYLYTINIKVKSLDEYFSTKETKIQDVKILSNNKS